ncbi:trypsin-like peptidase domain-containing protein [Glycomyces sp. NPDC048151]|uniref:trypsin-like peptidase domain-containing protein n=1 Tax=Glycomyces sp. NPDC048151 TaxID=3364002 RepID=UPI0037182128
MAPADRLWCSDERVVRISTVKRTGDRRKRHSLTGYLVADELVLTCAHDVSDAETREVCRPDAEPLPAELAWGPGESGIDIALLRVPGLNAPKGRVVWGEYTDYVGAKAARCIGFPRAEREGGAHHAALIDGGFVPGQGSGKGRMQFDFDSPDAVDHHDWAGLSGAMILDDHALLGVLAERSGTRRRRFNAIPAALILEQEGLCELLGNPELLALSDPHPLVRSPFEPLGEATEFKLITARYGQVPFVKESHGDALDALTSWCFDDPTDNASDVALRLLTGPAGAGKTRLAAELCRRIADKDPVWRAGFALDDPEAPWGSHAPQTPLLIVFDYVERSAVTAKVVEFLKHLERLGERLRFPVRVLLISRAAGGWYDQLSDQGGTLLQHRLKGEESPRIELRRGDFGPEQRAAHFRNAYARFTADIDEPADADRFIDLIEGEQYDSPLLVHIAALLAARGESLPSPERSGLRDRLLGFLLQRERERRWAAEPALSTTNVGPEESDQALHAVAIMTLTGPTVLEAAEFLKASDLWADQSNASRREAGKALARLYPAEDGRTAPIEPDLVSEHLVASIEDLPAVTASLHKMLLGTDHFARMLHLLTLTHDHYPDAVGSVKQMLVHALTRIVGGEDQSLSIAEVLDQSLPRLIEIAVRQVEGGEDAEVANLLSSALRQVADFERIAEVLADIEVLASHDDERLAQLGQLLYDIKLRHCREQSDTPGLLAALEGAARAYLEKGRFTDSFGLLHESMHLRVTLGAFENPVWTLEAMELIRKRLVEGGHHTESVQAAEALIEFMQLSGASLARAYEGSLDTLEQSARRARKEYRLDKARSTLDFTVRIRLDIGMSQRSDLLFAIEQYERIAAAAKEDFRNEALHATMAALRLQRRILDNDLGAYQMNFARLDEIFMAEERVDPDLVEEVSELLRWISAQDPGFRSLAAEELEIRASQLWWCERQATAVAELGAAVELRRRAARLDYVPDADLARALVEYGGAMWISGGNRTGALSVMADAEAELRLVAQETPRLWPEALRAMERRTAALWESGQEESAIGLMKELESIERARESFHSDDPEPPRDIRVGRYGAQPIIAMQQGMPLRLKVELLEKIVEDQPRAYSTLANVLEQLGHDHVQAEEPDAALEVMTRTVEIRQRLAEASPKLHGSKLVEALRFKIAILRGLERFDEAEDAQREFANAAIAMREVGMKKGFEPSGKSEKSTPP